jgi:hypothetical protein
MFEDKEKILQQSQNSEKIELTIFSQSLRKTWQKSLDPNKVTLAQLFTETLDAGGNDMSLM